MENEDNCKRAEDEWTESEDKVQESKDELTENKDKCKRTEGKTIDIRNESKDSQLLEDQLIDSSLFWLWIRIQIWI